MKAVFLQDDFPPRSMGGAGFSTYELAQGMKRLGHEVIVITTCRRKEEEGEAQYDGLTIFSIRSDYPERWRAWRGLYNVPVVRKVESLLKRLEPDVVHINNVHYHLSYHCFKIAKKYARAVVFTARDTMSVCYGKLGTERYRANFDLKTTWRDHIAQAGRWWNPLRNLFIKRYLTYADKIFAVSASLQNALVQHDIKNVEILHTGTDVSDWNASEEEKQTFKKKFGLEDKKIVLFGGRLSEGKGGEMIVQAISLIVKEIPDSVLLVVGSIDTYAKKMEQLAKSLNLNDKLIITDWVSRNEMRFAYATADVVVVPSLYLDPFPRVVIEGMASRKPVVGTCYGGAPEIIVDGATGYVVNPLHPEEIAEKTIELLKDSTKAKQFGEAGYERIRKEFSLEGMIQQYIVEYEFIMKNKKP